MKCLLVLFLCCVYVENDGKITFRFEGHYFERVRQIASARGISVHQAARDCVIAQLENTDILNVEDKVDEVMQTLLKLRSDFNAALE